MRVTPSAPSGSTGWRRLAAGAVLKIVDASLLVSPRPAVLMIRRLFARTGGRTSSALLTRAPSDVLAIGDERYAADADAVLDVYVPDTAAAAGEARPAVVWVHGGAFVGGTEDELAGYARFVASAGFTVVVPRYTRAPEATHPAPARQVMAALDHVQAHSARLHVDPTRLLLAGDSAGAHIAAQVATAVTSPAYAGLLGVAPTITPDQLRGVVLCCGVFDLALLDGTSPLTGLVRAVLWSYSGRRDHAADERFVSTMSVVRHVTEAFPPTFVTVGNADPLAAHSRAMAERLGTLGVEVDELFFATDHAPALGHEYQFDLDLADAGHALTCLLAFLRRRSAT